MTNTAYKPIPSTQLWKQFHKSIKANLESIKDKITESSYKVLNSKIENLNSPTNRDKLLKPFEFIGINLNSDDKDIIEHRNNYLHGNKPRYITSVSELHMDALKIHTLIILLLLKYSGYSGHYINLSGWFLLHGYENHDLIQNTNIEEIIKANKLIEKFNKNQIPISKNQDKKEVLRELKDIDKCLVKYKKYLIIVNEIQNLIKII